MDNLRWIMPLILFLCKKFVVTEITTLDFSCSFVLVQGPVVLVVIHSSAEKLNSLIILKLFDMELPSLLLIHKVVLIVSDYNYLDIWRTSV